MLRGNFTVKNTYLKQETSQINNLTLQLKETEKEQIKHKGSKKKEIRLEYK